MEILQTSSEGLRRTFSVTVPTQEFMTQYNLSLAKVSANTKMQGFRPGKVPLAVITQRYGKAIYEDTIESYVRNALKKIYEEHKIVAAAPPSLDFMPQETPAQDISFKILVDTPPVFELKDLGDLKLTNYEITVTDEQLTTALQQFHQLHKFYKDEEITRPIRENDRVTLEPFGKITVGNIKKNTKSDPLQLVVNAETPVFSGKLEKDVIGMNVGDIIYVEDHFPEDAEEQELAGKPVSFKAIIKKIEEPKMVPFGEEFAAELKKESLQQLCDDLREAMLKQGENLATLVRKRSMLDQLAEAYDFELPQSVVDTEFKTIWRFLMEEIQSKGQVLTEEERKAHKDQYKSLAERRVRLTYIFNKIAESNEIAPGEDDYKHAIIRVSFEEKVAPEKIMEGNKYHQKVRAALASVMEEKLVNFVLSKATQETKPISLDEFEALVAEKLYQEDETFVESITNNFMYSSSSSF